MGNAHATHAINDMRNNEKNLACLFLAVRPGGPLAVAFAEIYILLNQLAPGQTVREYCKENLGYNSQKYKDIFSTSERNILSDPSWDPKRQDVSFLYKLLRYVCGLSLDHQNWNDPTYEIEFHLLTAKNVRNDTMHDRSELTDVDLNNILQDLEDDVSKALILAGRKTCRDVSTLDSTFKTNIQKFRTRKNPLKLFADALRISSGSIGIPTRFKFGASPAGTASNSVGVASAATASGPMAAGSLTFGSASAYGDFESDELSSFGSACADEFGHLDSEQLGREELLKLLEEAESLEFHGVCTIIRRQLDLLNR